MTDELVERSQRSAGNQGAGSIVQDLRRQGGGGLHESLPESAAVESDSAPGPGGTLTVTVYTSPSCPGCMATKRHLKKIGVEFVEKSFADDPNDVEAARYLELGKAPVVCVTTPAGEHLWWNDYRPSRIEELKQFRRLGHDTHIAVEVTG